VAPALRDELTKLAPDEARQEDGKGSKRPTWILEAKNVCMTSLSRLVHPGGTYSMIAVSFVTKVFKKPVTNVRSTRKMTIKWALSKNSKLNEQLACTHSNMDSLPLISRNNIFVPPIEVVKLRFPTLQLSFQVPCCGSGHCKGGGPNSLRSNDQEG